MAEERLTLLTAREAAEYLRVSLYTLNKIEKQGRILPFRTPGSHRRYSLEMLNEYLEKSRTRVFPAESAEEDEEAHLKKYKQNEGGPSRAAGGGWRR
ncbi:MAG: helix-turn-helix domain-containing protein [Chloroflexi bacterium]|nr:helix-turn-helix domain-containing protein [Chloroflexota bacterium]